MITSYAVYLETPKGARMLWRTFPDLNEAIVYSEAMPIESDEYAVVYAQTYSDWKQEKPDTELMVWCVGDDVPF